MTDEQQTDKQEAAPAPIQTERPSAQGILVDMVSRETLRGMADEEDKAAAHMEQRAAAHLREAERLAGLAQRSRVRAEAWREV
jgi:hypothetical protein